MQTARSADRWPEMAWFQPTLERVPVGVVCVDATNVVRFSNEAARRLLGQEATPGGRGVTVALGRDDRARYEVHQLAAFTSGTTTTWQHSLTAADGREIWVEHTVSPFYDADGVVVGVMSALPDATHQHEVERALEGSRDFSTIVLDTVGAFVVVLGRDGRILRVNAAVARLGLTPDRLVGRSVLHGSLVPADRRDEVAAAFRASLEDRLSSRELALHLRDGSVRRVVWNTTTHRNSDGSVRTIIATGIDVTELRAAEARLNERDHLDSIGRLTAGVAHDFGNTLSVVRMRVDRLRSHDPSADTRDLDAIERSVAQAQALIADLLSFSRGHDEPVVHLPIDQAIGVALRDIHDVMRTSVTVAAHLSAKDALVCIGPTRFRRLLDNLCVNANDAMPDGGTLTLATDFCIADAEHQPPMPDGEPLATGRYVHFLIADTGAGIAADVLPHVFEPYFTTKPPARGTGLGLATVYGTVAQAGGRVRVNSAVGVGTTIEIWFPCAVA